MTERIEVVSGRPTDEELAAIVVALTPAAAAEDGAPPAPRGPSPWQRAAMLEARGARLVASRDDLTDPAR